MTQPNHLYQYSLLNALMSGVSTTGITPSLLRTKGTLGLGTFARMNGELLLLDQSLYQLLPEGKIRTVSSPDIDAKLAGQEVAKQDLIPFAVATQFVPQKVLDGVQLRDKHGIDEVLSNSFPHARNLFVTYKISGRFDYLKCRTVRGQEYDGQPLSEVGKNQSVESYEGVRGTIVGMRSPENWQGFSVAGEHLHFVDEGRERGGHVLELRGEEGVKVEMAVVRDVHVELPEGEEFNEAELKTDDEGVRKVEG